jgi:SPX domain protein involved in polyphosphate accumulation
MVNFAKRFFYAVITEWRDQYIDYKGLYKQIKLVKAAVLELAQAYANIKGKNRFSKLKFSHKFAVNYIHFYPSSR